MASWVKYVPTNVETRHALSLPPGHRKTVYELMKRCTSPAFRRLLRGQRPVCKAEKSQRASCLSWQRPRAGTEAPKGGTTNFFKVPPSGGFRQGHEPCPSDCLRAGLGIFLICCCPSHHALNFFQLLIQPFWRNPDSRSEFLGEKRDLILLNQPEKVLCCDALFFRGRRG